MTGESRQGRVLLSSILAAVCLVATGCPMSVNVCDPQRLTCIDADTCEPLVSAEVVVAWVEPDETVETEAELTGLGETLGSTNEYGAVELEVCGVIEGFVPVPYVPSGTFVPDDRVAILGVRRTAESLMEIARVEFGEMTIGMGGLYLPVRAVSSDTLIVAGSLDSNRCSTQAEEGESDDERADEEANAR